MAEVSGFFNSYNNDRVYYISFLAEYFSSFIGNGIFFGGNYLKVEPYGGNMDIQILEGKGWINGYYYANKDAPKVMTVEPAHLTLPRIDAVVLRCDLRESNRAITVEIKKGIPAETPLCPELQRDDAMHELKLAEIRVNANVTEIFAANITDYRLNSDACGIVMNFVPNDFTYDDIFNQYLSQLELRMANWDVTKASQETQWDAQMTAQQTAWSEQTATQQSQFDTQKTEIEIWYDTVKVDITKLQTFDFDNLATFKGCTRVTNENADGSVITETILITASQVKVSERVNTTNPDGSMTVVLTVYDTDGVTPLLLKGSTTTVTFSEDGKTITEVVE